MGVENVSPCDNMEPAWEKAGGLRIHGSRNGAITTSKSQFDRVACCHHGEDSQKPRELVLQVVFIRFQPIPT